MLARFNFIMTVMPLIVSLSCTAQNTNTDKRSHSKAGHSHEHHGKGELRLNNGQKWQGDKHLHENMSKIIASVNEGIQQSNGNISTETFKKIGDVIESSVNDIFKNCKLPADADAQLHIVLIEIIKAKQELATSADLDSGMKALESLQTSTQKYLEYFDHKN